MTTVTPPHTGIATPLVPPSDGGTPDELLDLACHTLSRGAPAYSAERLLVPWQRATLAVLAVVVVVSLVLAPVGTGVVLVSLATAAYGLVLVLRLLLFQRGGRGAHRVTVTDAEARAVPDHELPTYTVLVPAFHEPLIADVVAAVEDLDYPRDRLSIRLLLEADDTETVTAARALAPRPHLTLVEVPEALPRTKPKACNLGLLTSDGELCTIFDAEDRPDPLQLRRAVVALDRLGPDHACVQAALGFYNSRQNLLTRWFALDYGAWFSQLLPGLVASGAPIPLGGTSNHFRTDILREVGGWDPFNVTEDADLGLRLDRAGYRVGILDSVTSEEANPDPINWIRQRSRWYKGYLVTALVHLREPRLTSRQLGPRALGWLIAFVAGTPLLSALNGVFWAMTIMWVTARSGAVAALFPAGVYHLGLACLVLGNLAMVYVNVFTARAMQRPDLLLPALLTPAYWVLMWVAAVKALVQLVRDPAYWEKTTNGLHTEGGQS